MVKSETTLHNNYDHDAKVEVGCYWFLSDLTIMVIERIRSWAPKSSGTRGKGLLDLPPEVTLPGPIRTQSGSLNNYAMQTGDIGVLSQTTCCTDFRVVVNHDVRLFDYSLLFTQCN